MSLVLLQYVSLAKISFETLKLLSKFMQKMPFQNALETSFYFYATFCKLKKKCYNPDDILQNYTNAVSIEKFSLFIDLNTNEMKQ